MQKFLLNFLRKIFPVQSALHNEAVVAVMTHTASQLEELYHTAEQRWAVAACDEDSRVAAANITKYEIAFAAREAWEAEAVYRKTFDFPPHAVARNMKAFEAVFEKKKLETQKAEKNVTLDVFTQQYTIWKQGLQKFLEMGMYHLEKELHVAFMRLLQLSFPWRKENDIRCFVQVGKSEADIMLDQRDGFNMSVVEVKRFMDGDNAMDLLAALYQAALYVFQACSLEKNPGSYRRRIAAVSLPILMSRLGEVEFTLDGEGDVKEGVIRVGTLKIWEESEGVDSKAEMQQKAVRDEVYTVLKEEGIEEAKAKKAAEKTARKIETTRNVDLKVLANEIGAEIVPEVEAAYELVYYVQKCLIRANENEQIQQKNALTPQIGEESQPRKRQHQEEEEEAGEDSKADM
eukprot:Polyplicarium_translucidae@DN3402_c0_g2_i1.p1